MNNKIAAIKLGIWLSILTMTISIIVIFVILGRFMMVNGYITIGLLSSILSFQILFGSKWEMFISEIRKNWLIVVGKDLKV